MCDSEKEIETLKNDLKCSMDAKTKLENDKVCVDFELSNLKERAENREKELLDRIRDLEVKSLVKCEQQDSINVCADKLEMAKNEISELKKVFVFILYYFFQFKFEILRF